MLAASKGRDKIVKQLIKAKATVDLQNEVKKCLDVYCFQ